MTPTSNQANRRTYLGLFLLTAAILMFEILLTRIFSVTIWYHFAFMAISIAMFGLTAGALWVYLRPELFTPETVHEQMGRYSLLFGLGVVVSVFFHLLMPSMSAPSLISTFLVAAIPMTFGGVAVCLALTRFPHQVGRLYAADLGGAATGCILLVLLLEIIDGISAVLAVAALGALGGLAFLPRTSRQRRLTIASMTLLAAVAAANGYLAHLQRAPLRVVWAKGKLKAQPLYEKWNSFSRITVFADPSGTAFGSGLSPAYTSDRKIDHYRLQMDAHATTLLTAFDGDLSQVDHLKYDITNIALHLRPRGSILIIGAGGGRDVLSSLAFGMQEIVAVELNANIVRTVNERYGEFTGHLDRDPRVTFVNDEARSFIARQERHFDVIQASWIDTWAATTAGAFVLTENSLYTLEAWEIFLEHLTPEGVLTMTRVYFGKYPFEAARLVSLARAALLETGVVEPERHIMLILTHGNATILLSPSPFPRREIEAIRELTSEMQFEIGYLPGSQQRPAFARLAAGKPLEGLGVAWNARLDPPTDDSPFFFNLMRIRDVLSPGWWQSWRHSLNLQAIAMLVILLALVFLLTLACMAVPFFNRGRERASSGRRPLVIYFAAIGLGFMLVEISLMQRLIIFLGHPVYGLTVVLFTVLLASGVGSFSSDRTVTAGLWRRGLFVLAGLAAVLLLAGVLVPEILTGLRDRSTPVRIAAAVALVFPPGFFMGMMFPLGMRAAREQARLTPWLWSINGASSVFGSVLAIVLALELGITVSYWTGTASYLVAAIAFFGCPRTVLSS